MDKTNLNKTVMMLHFGANQFRGSEVCFVHSVHTLVENDFEVLVLRKDACIDEMIFEKASAIIDEPFPEIMLDGSYRSLPLIKYFKSLYRMYNLVKSYKPCMIYCNSGLPCQLAVPIGKLLKIPVLCHFHHPASKRYFYFWLVKYATKLIFPSDFTRSVVADKCGRDGDVIYNAVDIKTRFTLVANRDESYRLALGFQETDIVIGQVGNLTTHKRPDVLIKCFADAYQQNNNLRLVLIGDGTMRNELDAIINELELTSVVKLTGYVPDVLPYYQHVIDINVLASMNEGLGISVIEASACGLPSIVTDCTGLREVVDKDLTGLTFEQDDLDQLISDILYLSKNTKARQRMGLAARKKCEKLFSLDQYKKGIMHQVKSLCESI
ncbi:glycosyltransferase family 4 protein [bacterium]|nr:glycosyltransferase family 4 protein [bacterium]